MSSWCLWTPYPQRPRDKRWCSSVYLVYFTEVKLTGVHHGRYRLVTTRYGKTRTERFVYMPARYVCRRVVEKDVLYSVTKKHILFLYCWNVFGTDINYLLVIKSLIKDKRRGCRACCHAGPVSLRCGTLVHIRVSCSVKTPLCRVCHTMNGSAKYVCLFHLRPWTSECLFGSSGATPYTDEHGPPASHLAAEFN